MVNMGTGDTLVSVSPCMNPAGDTLVLVVCCVMASRMCHWSAPAEEVSVNLNVSSIPRAEARVYVLFCFCFVFLGQLNAVMLL